MKGIEYCRLQWLIYIYIYMASVCYQKLIVSTIIATIWLHYGQIRVYIAIAIKGVTAAA